MLDLPNMAQDITFEEEGHIYRMGNMIIPSVTSIMKPIYSFDGINADVLQHAAERGSSVHFAIEKFLTYNYASKLNEEEQPYFDRFMEWFNKNTYNREDFACEISGYNKIYNICGTIDIIRQDEKGYHLIDLKTGATPNIKVWSVQMSGYELILKSHGITLSSKTVLHLSKEKCTPYACSDQLGTFFNCLGIYNFLNSGS